MRGTALYRYVLQELLVSRLRAAEVCMCVCAYVYIYIYVCVCVCLCWGGGLLSGYLLGLLQGVIIKFRV